MANYCCCKKYIYIPGYKILRSNIFHYKYTSFSLRSGFSVTTALLSGDVYECSILKLMLHNVEKGK